MKIQLNDNNIITSYANIGDIEGSIEISEDQLPNDFYENYKRGYYKYDEENQLVVRNENYDEEFNMPYPNNEQVPNDVPNLNNEELNKVILMLSNLQKINVKAMITNEKLVKQNAQLTKDVVDLKNKINEGGN